MRNQFIWNIAAQAVGLVLPPLLIIVLARILEPSDFGVFALLMVVILVIQAISLSPLGEIIIKSDLEHIGDFVFTLQLIIGIGFSVLLLLFAESIAGLFNTPELAAPLRFSCLLLLVSPLVDTAIRINMRNMAFKAVFVRRVISPVANAFVSIPLALYGVGYWALVWGQLSGYIVTALVLVSMGGWHPRLNYQFVKFKDDVLFTWQMILQSMVRWIRSQSDNAILGVYNSVSGLGQYDLARKFAGMPFAAIVQPVAQVLYAVMSERIRRNEEIGALFLISQRRILMISLPLCVMMLMNAEGIIAIVLGDKWVEILPIFVVMAAVGALSSFVGLNMEVFKAKGEPKIMTRFMLVRAAFTVPVFLWLAPMGITELSFGVLGLGLVFSPINIWLTLRLLGVQLRQYLIEVLYRPILVALAVYAASLAVAQTQIGQWQLTISNFIVGGFIMLLAALYWERDLFKWKSG